MEISTTSPTTSSELLKNIIKNMVENTDELQLYQFIIVS